MSVTWIVVHFLALFADAVSGASTSAEEATVRKRRRVQAVMSLFVARENETGPEARLLDPIGQDRAVDGRQRGRRHAAARYGCIGCRDLTLEDPASAGDRGYASPRP